MNHHPTRWLHALGALLLAVAALGSLLPQAALAQAASSADTDFDGIPDEWERLGHGPLRPEMVRVGRRDVIIYTVRRGIKGSTPIWPLTVDASRELMNQVTTFYRNLPVRNPDGSSGIHITVVEGPAVAYSLWSKVSFMDVYHYLPVAWRGIARLYVLEVAELGGQTFDANIAASGGPWQAIAHEVGHMLGLDHTPRYQLASGVSPLWPSIMNYLYTYSLNDDPMAVRMSTGEFSRIILNEGSLSERINMPIEKLRLLEGSPNNFRLRVLADGSTGVDWNRDGRIDEGYVRADINDGYGVQGRVPAQLPDRTRTAPALAVVDGRLVTVYGKPDSAASTWTTGSLTTATPDLGTVLYASVLLSSGSMSSPVSLRHPTNSNPSAVGYNGMLAVGYTTFGRPDLILHAMDTANVGARVGGATDTEERADQVVLVSGRVSGAGSEPALFMLTWQKATGKVRYARVETLTPGSTGTPRFTLSAFRDLQRNPGSAMISLGPVGAAIDPLTGELVLVQNKYDGVGSFLNLVRLNWGASGWAFGSERWLGDSSRGSVPSNDAPAITLDPSTPINGRSQINVYARPPVADGVLTVTIKHRELPDRTQGGGWRVKRMIDEWNTSQSPAAAVRFGNTDAFALRWKAADERPNLLVLYTQTGILPGFLTDQDDVGMIAAANVNAGMALGLRRLRCYFESTGVDYGLTPRECP